MDLKNKGLSDDELAELFKWKSKLSMKKVCKALDDIAETTKTVIKNGVEDLQYFFEESLDCVKGCGTNLDNIRLRMTHRAIQYHTSTIQTLARNNLLPADFVNYIYSLISEEITRNPNPKIFLLDNPYNSIWNTVNPEEPKLIEIDPNTHIPDKTKESWLFIHGMLYKGMNHDGSDISTSDLNIYDFYYSFEEEARMFKNGDESKADIYLVSYDSEMNRDERRIIEAAIAGHITGTLGAFELLVVGAVFWREMERRAVITGDYIEPFLRKLNKAGNKGTGTAVTHSLGCYVLAHAGQSIHDVDNMGQSFKEWWCMNAALPSDAFSNTGDFPNARFIAGLHGEGERAGTTVWYSLSDIVLMMIYPLATYHPALGQTGCGLSKREGSLEDIDLTEITDVYHGFEGEYIKRLGSCIRKFLQSNTNEIC